MRTKKYIPILLSVLLSGSILIGCQKSPAESTEPIQENSVEEAATPADSDNTEATTSVIESEEPVQEEPTSEEVLEEPEINTVFISFTIINNCNADIGMFSVIDPITKEQVNVEPLANGESLSLESDWPIGVTDFQWAVYNTSGELYTEGTTDISQAKTAVIITLQGDGSIDKINTSFK